MASSGSCAQGQSICGWKGGVNGCACWEHVPSITELLSVWRMQPMTCCRLAMLMRAAGIVCLQDLCVRVCTRAVDGRD
jgi:hypothetical protein